MDFLWDYPFTPKGLGKVGIIGWGIVGCSTGRILGAAFIKPFDKTDYEDESLLNRLKELPTFLICLPTPTVKGKQDLEAMYQWLQKIAVARKNQETLVIIRSTILPGTTRRLMKTYPDLLFAHVPEFLNEKTAVDDARHPEFLVVGTENPFVFRWVCDVFRNLNIKKDRIIYCSPTTAEIIKYTMNAFFALKVIFGNQIWELCGDVGADYAPVVKALETHKWGSKNGWRIWSGGYRGYAGACLPKDIEALTSVFDLPLLKKMQQINKELIKATKFY